MELAPLEQKIEKKNDGLCSDHSSAFIFNWIFFILSGIKDNNKSLDEFEFQVDPTLDCGVNSP